MKNCVCSEQERHFLLSFGLFLTLTRLKTLNKLLNVSEATLSVVSPNDPVLPEATVTTVSPLVTPGGQTKNCSPIIKDHKKSWTALCPAADSSKYSYRYLYMITNCSYRHWLDRWRRLVFNTRGEKREGFYFKVKVSNDRCWMFQQCLCFSARLNCSRWPDSNSTSHSYNENVVKCDSQGDKIIDFRLLCLCLLVTIQHRQRRNKQEEGSLRVNE